ncbi:Rhodanese-like domain-containing protein 11, chloroplastic [Apostasia shenzhenica]|uniref:Rhodanese-like domain-containing protein 11, chloroplastic n=1 Tax=Apostasia shenzhenica TaxID=1088818 RepID=A0A2I0B0W1_9ASPA|nr:Rhodanese-like domain-containing protein 11, chloroplastic [Apostasia shenzhenica]
MEVVGHHFAGIITNPSSDSLRRRSSKSRTRVHLVCRRNPFSSSSRRSIRTYYQNARPVMGAVVGEEEETKQAKEMAAARKRWEALIREQQVKVLTPKEAGYAIQLSYKTLLDVRPSVEYNKARVKGSTWIPIFDVYDKFDMGSLSRKITNFVMGGWWSGSPTLVYDKNFISKLEEKFSKDSDLIVVCQKGLRSLAACEQLYSAGYKNLFWVQGGLEAAEEEDFQREGPQPFKLAGIGGASAFLGWTDQQRAIAAKEGWGYRLIFTGRLLALVLIGDALFFGAQRLGPFLEHLRSH